MVKINVINMLHIYMYCTIPLQLDFPQYSHYLTCIYIYIFFIVEKMKAGVSVDTIKFCLFLYIQQVHKISLRDSIVGGEEYPFSLIDVIL